MPSDYNLMIENRNLYDMNQEIHIAAYYGELSYLQFLIKEGSPLNCKNSDGNTPLILAAYGPNKKIKLKILRLLLKNGAIINDTNNLGNSVLHAAVYGIAKGTVNERCITWLLKMGADFRLSNYKGKTVLQIALQYELTYISHLILMNKFSYVDSDEDSEALIVENAIIFTSFKKCMRVSRLKENRKRILTDVWNNEDDLHDKGINVISYNFPHMCT